MKQLIIKSFYNVSGGISIGNGLWMLFSASTWFTMMPVGAENTGPLNSHFVHDVGLVYILVGIGAFWCASKLDKAIEIHLAITFFMAGHALIHIGEILSGSLPASHWLIDFPLVTFPAIVLVGLTPVMLKRK
ncbi:hypothetical protein QQ020_23535 [Fulvivirgaceae bacterium BMA12]|uniref:Uncharacterized protein n=1 Tax=Agaribacillus aureus TaxID=3051825 RepID=A0ABT8LBB3_9BACT|nr:hypothetical protein [Fulvivirgaceae bacterium BMA12]